ncbi:ribonuclease HII [Peptoniphilus catoniae]|uniref:ribonuclease HII n=1 Tax=Peptoniphilus catoniae TaxID=1660341 RepID=UPI0010FD1068|nr:ribonuclease HII [Peptoniphilus catoniae]
MENFEEEYSNNGYKYIAGIDEVGRGSLFGDVLACSIIMPLENRIEGVTDSKKLSRKKRDYYYELILKNMVAVGIGRVNANLIDKINIKNATHLAMIKSVKNLRNKYDKQIRPDLLLIDAEHIEADIEQVSIIKGDDKCYTIACASIVAKVYRDKLCEIWAKSYPEYGIDKHMGYGTKKHREMIKLYGPSDMHRKTFVKNSENW